jgi:hypothetical protein
MAEIIQFIPRVLLEIKRRDAELDRLSREIVTRASEIRKESTEAVNEAQVLLEELTVLNQNSQNFEERDQA